MPNKTGLRLGRKTSIKVLPPSMQEIGFFILPDSVFNKTDHNSSSSGLFKSSEVIHFYFECAIQNYCRV